MGLFAVSLNLLLGYTGLVSFGQAAYFGMGAYTCALLMKKAALAFPFAFVAAGIAGALGALIIGFFCIRLTQIYFSMLTLAFSQIVWAIVFKWNSLTRGGHGTDRDQFPAVHGFHDALLLLHFGVVVASLYTLCVRSLILPLAGS